MSDRLSLFKIAGFGAAFLLLGLVLGAIWSGNDRAASDCTALAEQAAHEASAAKLACKELAADARAAEAEELRKLEEKKKQHSCNVCGSAKAFTRFGGRNNARCPVCTSKERHRLLALYLENETPLFRKKMDVLHFGANIGLRDMLSKLPNLHYVTADLYKADADLKLDITAIDVPDATWDVVIAYHILEHVMEDEKAMRELFRILRPGGQAILQVPLDLEQKEIYEDPTVTGKEERRKAFGEADHVRRYSVEGLRKRLEKAGFAVEAVDYLAVLDPMVIKRHKLDGKFAKRTDQRIWIARKPDASREEPAQNVTD